MDTDMDIDISMDTSADMDVTQCVDRRTRAHKHPHTPQPDGVHPKTCSFKTTDPSDHHTRWIARVGGCIKNNKKTFQKMQVKQPLETT